MKVVLRLILASLVLTAVACAPSGGTRGKSGDPAAPTNYDHLNAEEKAAMSEVLTDEAEEKLTFTTLHELKPQFEEAVKLGKGNVRAKFWLEIMNPLLKMRGILNRIRPLYLQQEHGMERYQILVRGLEQTSSSDYRRFLTESDNSGSAETREIHTDKEFRLWMDEVIVSLNQLRLFLKENKDRTIQLRVPQKWMFGDSAPEKHLEKQDGRCGAFSFMFTRVAACSNTGMVTFKVNRADLEGIQYFVSAQMFQLSVLYAFNLNPIVMFDGFANRSTKDVVRMLTKGYDGSLLHRNRINIGKDLLPEWLAAQKYFISSQSELCRTGDYSTQNRPGYLFSTGYCLERHNSDVDRKAIAIVETLIAGQPIEVEQYFLEKKTTVDVVKFILEPPSNILPLMPTAYTFDGAPLAVENSAYEKYFGSGSMLDVLRAQELERQYEMLQMSQWRTDFQPHHRARLNELAERLGAAPSNHGVGEIPPLPTPTPLPLDALPAAAAVPGGM
jgi:hypothetical protein